MADIPRRLPPSDAERLRIVVTRTAGGGDLGSTRWAQPVTKTSNYAPVNAPSSEPPAVDVGIYTAGLPLAQTLVSNDTGDPGEDVHYDVVVGTIGGADLDGNNVLAAGRAYLVEGVVTASMNVGETPANALDGLQVFARLDLDDASTRCAVDASYPSDTRVWDDYPPDTSNRPVFALPDALDATGPDDSTLRRCTFRLTAVVEFQAFYGGAPAVSLVVRSSGPGTKLLYGGAFLRVSYLYDVASPV